MRIYSPFAKTSIWGWRGQLLGWTCTYAPQSKIYHKVSATGGGVLASY